MANDTFCGKNCLTLNKLCADHIKVCSGKVEKVVSNDICSQDGYIKNLYVDSQVVNDICSPGSVQAKQVWADKTYTNSLCATSANLTNACISNLTIGNFSPCIKCRATVNYAVDTTYVLGNFLNFLNIVDDPNNSVSLNPTTYTAPMSGYYMMSYKVNVTNIVSTNGPVLGIPVANPEVYVNGFLVREAYSPFLSFFNTQKVIVDSLITLQAGDKVTMKYNVLAGNGSAVTGTVDIIGAGIEDGNSLFKIIFLSGLCENGPQAQCPPCPEVTIPCQNVEIPCMPLDICRDCDNGDTESPGRKPFSIPRAQCRSC